MIPKVIGRRASFERVLRYLASEGQNREHVNPRVLAGDREAEAFVGQALDGDSVKPAAEYLDSARRVFESRVGEPAWHCSLAVRADEGPLSDERWRAISERFVERMGFDRSAWLAVHHGPTVNGHDHVHLVVSMVRDDGRAVRLGLDRPRSQQVAREIEREFGLSAVEGRELGVGARGYTRGERALAERQGRTETQRQYLERAVRGCLATSSGPAEFAQRLERGGISVQWRVKDGATVGYSVCNGDGIGYAGGKLARDLAYPRLAEHWRTGSPQSADQAAQRAAGRAAWASLRSEPAGRPGPLARESRELGGFAQTRSGAGPLALGGIAAAMLRQRIAAAEMAAEEAEREREQVRQPWLGRSVGRGRGVGIE